MKKIFKILLYLILTFVVLIGIFVSYVSIKGIPTYEVDKIDYLQVEQDSTLLELGEKIAAVECIVCHRGSDGKLSGKLLTEVPSDFGEMHSANITQSKEHGIGKWTDAQLVVLLRTGVKPDGSFGAFMPRFPHMSDRDIKAVLTFLHSQNNLVQPSEIQSIASKPSLLTKFLCIAGPFKKVPYPKNALADPDTNDVVAFGKYLIVGRYDCYTCHANDFKTLNMEFPEKTPGYLGGGNTLITPNGNKIFAANISSDEKTGIGSWTEEDFSGAMLQQVNKQGKHLRQPMLPYNGMTNQEIHAIWQYILSMPKISNQVDRQWEKEL